MAVNESSADINAFTTASLVEQRGLAILLPYLKERAFKSRLVSTARGTLARMLQQDFGDFLLNTDDHTIWSVEIKVAQLWTGNLFLETWSNRNLEDKASHAQLGSAPGWLLKTRADVLLYYFLDTDDLVTLPVLRLKQWAFGSGEEGGIYRWPEKRQGRYAQANDSWGRCVPVDVLEREVGAERAASRLLRFYMRLEPELLYSASPARSRINASLTDDPRLFAVSSHDVPHRPCRMCAVSRKHICRISA